MKFNIRVDQPKSAFARGNERWTNRDLDPVPPGKRKWRAIHFVAYWISDGESRIGLNRLKFNFYSVQLCDLGVCEQYSGCRPDMARITCLGRHRLLHHLLRHLFQRCNWGALPCPIPRARSCFVGVLGIVLARRESMYPGCLLVCDSDHERRKHRSRHDRRNMAVVPHAT